MQRKTDCSIHQDLVGANTACTLKTLLVKLLEVKVRLPEQAQTQGDEEITLPKKGVGNLTFWEKSWRKGEEERD